MSELEGLGLGAGPELAPQQEAPAQEPSQVRAWAAQEFAPAEERVDYLPPADVDGSARHPFRTVDREYYLAEIKGAGIARRSHGAPIALVNLADLVGIQGSVNPERVGHHLADPHLYQPGARAPGHGMLVDRPVVVRKGGTMYIHDGHHRLTATSLRGLSTAKVRLVDLDVAT